MLYLCGCFGGFEIEYYVNWKEFEEFIDEDIDFLLMLIEYLYGFYDGGGGVSFFDYW